MLRAGSPYEDLIRLIGRAESVRTALLCSLTAGIRVGALGVVGVAIATVDAVASDLFR